MSDNSFMVDDLNDDCLNDYCQSLGVAQQSKYYSVKSFMNIFKNNSGYFSLCNYNIRSFNANFDEFSVFLESFGI